MYSTKYFRNCGICTVQNIFQVSSGKVYKRLIYLIDEVSKFQYQIKSNQMVKGNQTAKKQCQSDNIKPLA